MNGYIFTYRVMIFLEKIQAHSFQTNGKKNRSENVLLSCGYAIKLFCVRAETLLKSEFVIISDQ